MLRNRAWVSWLPAPIQNRLHDRYTAQAVLANSGWLIFDRAGRMLTSLLVGVWMIRYLGPSQYGELAYILACVAFFQVLVSLGLDSIVVREVAIDSEQAPHILGSTLFLRSTAGIFGWLIAIASMAIFESGPHKNILLICIAGSSLVFQAADSVDLWFQSQNQSRRTVTVKLIAHLAANGFKVGLILLQAPLVYFAGAVAIEALLCACGLFFAYTRFRTSTPWFHTATKSMALLSESFPFIISGISTIIYMRIDQFMIKHYLGDTQLGIYSSIILLSQALNFLPATIVSSILPHMARISTTNVVTYEKFLIKIFRFFFYGALFFSLCISFFSSNIISAFYGSAYVSGNGVLALHIFSNVFIWLGVAHTIWVVIEKKPSIRVYGTLIAAVANIICNIALIPHLGLLGACYATIVSQFIAAVGINLFLAKRSFQLQLSAIFFIPFPAARTLHG
ncbi:hypothetical protein IGB42_04043 [Andreprevotia sp. IGB-42]|uniref:flippase n=1 Tax=Andreprevotia sp. IGB-42 TaxID=2497473 RepID=UPI0013593E7B|nr:flippase [Andreprevotia sp. IGB-42]KAF0811511.1 hypothetical protein IGB42_04043 [Andreprevotia sp. IGB-42]